MDGPEGLRVDEEDLVRVEAARIRTAFVLGAAEVVAQQGAAAFAAAQEIRFSHRDGEEVFAVGLKELTYGKAAAGGHALHFAFAQSDAECVATMGHAGLRSTDEGGVTGAQKRVRRIPWGDGGPDSLNAFFYRRHENHAAGVDQDGGCGDNPREIATGRTTGYPSRPSF